MRTLCGVDFCARALWLAILAPSAAACAQGKDSSAWLRVGRSPDLVVFVDTVRVRTDSVGLRAWMRFDATRSFRVKGETDRDSTALLQRIEIEEYLDCASRRVRDIEMQVFDSTGAQVGRHVWDAPKWIPFAQHTAGAKYFAFACDGLRAARRAGSLPNKALQQPGVQPATSRFIRSSAPLMRNAR